MPFEKACDLVARRRVIMKKGFAFLHFEDLVSIICREFKDTLGEGAHSYPSPYPSPSCYPAIDDCLCTRNGRSRGFGAGIP